MRQLQNFISRGLCGALLLLSQVPAAAAPPLQPHPSGTPWPTRSWPQAPLPADVDANALGTVLTNLFDPQPPAGHPDTRALLIVRGGRIVLETYAPGFGPDSRFMSWSMAKSVTNAITGLLVADGVLALDQPVPVADWQGEDDPRRAITLRQMLNMTSGIDNANSSSGAISFVSDMLFGESATHTARAAIERPLIHAPGSFWAYSTGTSNILGALVTHHAGPERRQVADFVRRRLFHPLGIESMELEFDMAGNFVGGVFVWANARDWARLGYLYLRDGMWDGQRLLPEGWVDFTRTPAPAENNATYGAHFWVAGPRTDNQSVALSVDTGTFWMNGAQGQIVAMVPKRDLIIVRLGEQHTETWQDTTAMTERLIQAFSPSGPSR